MGVTGGPLVNDDRGVYLHEVVQPARILFREIDAAVRALGRENVAAGISVRIVGAGAVVGAPPAIVEKVAIAVILQREIDRRVRIPLRRIARRSWCRLENGGRLYALDPPYARRRGQIGTSRCYQKRIDQLAVVVDAHGLLL